MSTVDENIEMTVKLKKDKKTPTKVGVVLTEIEYNTISGMITSKDPADHTVAQQILNQCDVQKSIYWIYKLAKKNASNMVYLRTKASRQFAKESDLFQIVWMNSTKFALHLITKGWMTPEIYLRLKESILKDLRDKNYSDNLYDLHVTIRPEFKQFDIDDVLTPLNNNNDKQ